MNTITARFGIILLLLVFTDVARAQLAPAILVQPQSQTVVAGTNVSFSVTASGTLLSYQWRKNGSAMTNGGKVSGVNTATLTLTGVASADAANYSVFINNLLGNVTSSNAVLTVSATSPPSIVVQPQSQTVVAGTNVSFTVTATGSALSYQWLKNGFNLINSGNIAGVNSATLTLAGVSAGDAANYSLQVYNPAGSVTSSNASLAVVVPPRITIPPASQSLVLGRTATFKVIATGSAPLQYQWKKLGLNVAGATNATLILSNVLDTVAGIYNVVVANPGGSVTSPDATLTVRVPPLIVLQPQSQTVNAGANATFSVTAVSVPALFSLTYQWQNNGVAIPNATNSSLTLAGVQGTNAGNYNVMVSDSDATVASAVASLVVNLPALPFADNFTSRVSTNSFSGSGSGNNINATKETGEPKHAGKTGGKSVWLVWQAPTNGVATFSTRGSSIDTLLGIYTGDSLTNLTEVASDDDSGGFYSSQARFNALAGTNYIIAVDGVAGASGRIVLSWNLDGTVAEVPQITSHPASQTVSASSAATFSVTATSSTALTYQWYHDKVAVPGATNSTLSVSNVQKSDLGTYTAVVANLFGQTATSLPAVLEIGPNSDAQTKDKFEDLFEVAGAGAGSSAKTIRRRLAGFPSVGAGALGTQIFNNFNSSDQSGQPENGVSSDSSTRWFQITAAADGIMVMNTIGSDIDTVLSVYTGNDILSLALVADDDNGAPDGVRSRVSFSAVGGTSYVIAVGGVNGAQGNITLNWGLGTPPSFTLQPSDLKASISENVMLEAQAIGLPAPVYQWRKDGAMLPGQTGASLIFDHVMTSDAGRYDVVASNFTGVAVSELASLSVGTAARLVNNTHTNLAFSMTIQTEAGKTYELQSTDSLESGSWNAIRTISGNGLFQIFTDPQANVPRRFYRLLIY